MSRVNSILFATDLSEATKKLVPYVKYLTEKFNAKLYVITVIEEPPDTLLLYQDLVDLDLSEYEEEFQKEVKGRLDDLVKSSFLDLPQVEATMLIGTAHKKIVEFAEKNDVDLIVMGSATKEGFAERLFGKTAIKVVADAPCPVLTINPFKVEG